MSKTRSQEIHEGGRKLNKAVPDVLTFDLDALVRENVISLFDAPQPDIATYYT